MSLIIEKVENGWLVSHHDKRHVATAQHVANFIVQFWPDVAHYVQKRLSQEQQQESALSEGESMVDDSIQNH